MTLSERERRALAEIEGHLIHDDPALGRRLSSLGRRRTGRLLWRARGRSRAYVPTARRWAVAAVVLLAGVVLTLIGGTLQMTPMLIAGTALVAAVPLLAVVPSILARRTRPPRGTPSRVP